MSDQADLRAIAADVRRRDTWFRDPAVVPVDGVDAVTMARFLSFATRALSIGAVEVKTYTATRGEPTGRYRLWDPAVVWVAVATPDGQRPIGEILTTLAHELGHVAGLDEPAAQSKAVDLVDAFCSSWRERAVSPHPGAGGMVATTRPRLAMAGISTGGNP